MAEDVGSGADRVTPTFLSIVAASKRPEALRGLLENLASTTSEPSRIEVLVRTDDDDEAMDGMYLDGIPFRVELVPEPRGDGYAGLWRSYNRLFERSTGEHVLGLGDEARFAAAGWDDVLRTAAANYSGCYHLRLSARSRYTRFASLPDAICHGESFPVLSRAWALATGGPAAGPGCCDSGQECVHYFLRTRFGLDRGFPVDGVEFVDEVRTIAPDIGLSPEAWERKLAGIFDMYTGLLSFDGMRDLYGRAANVARALGIDPPEFTRADWLLELANTRQASGFAGYRWDDWPPLVRARASVGDA